MGGKWYDENSGCDAMREEKKKHCNYSSSDTSYPTSTPTSNPTEEDDTADDADKLSLTEAGWCEKCQGKWHDENSGCDEMREEKKKHCNYSSSDTSYPTSTPTSNPTEEDDTADDGDKLSLTEAGWCAKCQGKWYNKAS